MPDAAWGGFLLEAPGVSAGPLYCTRDTLSRKTDSGTGEGPYPLGPQGTWRVAGRRRTGEGRVGAYLALLPAEADPDFSAAPPAAAGPALLPLPAEADPERPDARVETMP